MWYRNMWLSVVAVLQITNQRTTTTNQRTTSSSDRHCTKRSSKFTKSTCKAWNITQIPNTITLINTPPP